MIRTKICGITRAEDIALCAEVGVDAIGLVFVEKSPRYVSTDQAAMLVREAPPFVTRVGLFMNAEAEQVEDVLARVAIDVLQFHGNESAAFCKQFSRPWIKALALNRSDDQTFAEYAEADALLLDAHAGSTMGGSGESFDWSAIPDLPRPWILAGGLNPDNVAEACRIARPHAVDVSSGVESRPGIKNDSLVQRFFNAVNEEVIDG
ncbi:MAG: phosphoribosylanthranilate isomerase [Pseudomonadota bacterium]